MTHEEINKKIAELKGECWHEPEYQTFEREGVKYRGSICKNCGKHKPLNFSNTDYAGDISKAWNLWNEMAEWCKENNGYMTFRAHANGRSGVSLYKDAPMVLDRVLLASATANTSEKAISLAYIRFMEGKG